MGIRLPELVLLLAAAVPIVGEDLVSVAGLLIPRAEAAAFQEKISATSIASVGEAVESNSYGVKDEFIVTLGAPDFQIRNANWASANLINGAYLAITTGSTDVAASASLNLPSGVLIKSVTMYYYDTHTTLEPAASLVRYDNSGASTGIASSSGQLSFSGGYTSVTNTLVTPHTVDNSLGHYAFVVILRRNGSEEHRLLRVQVKCQRQVAPAPASATFADVPTTHPFYQFIEALAASGITGGCTATPLNFCPDQAITRGQMAAFLARALGLHWPN